LDIKVLNCEQSVELLTCSVVLNSHQNRLERPGHISKIMVSRSAALIRPAHFMLPSRQHDWPKSNWRWHMPTLPRDWAHRSFAFFPTRFSPERIENKHAISSPTAFDSSQNDSLATVEWGWKRMAPLRQRKLLVMVVLWLTIG